MASKKPSLRLVGVNTSLAGRSFYVVPASSFRTTYNYADKPYINWMKHAGAREAKNPKSADILLFTGGTDISPSLYHQPAHFTNQCASKQRDRREVALFLANPDKLKVGVCRGAQLLNVLSGGSLIQHIVGNHHKRSHDVMDKRNERIIRSVASTHHQMMLPARDMAKREILLLAHNGGSKDDPRGTFTMCDDWKNKEAAPGIHKDVSRAAAFLKAYNADDFRADREDLEGVYYNNTHSLCIQAHPEGNRSGEIFSNWCVNEIEARLQAHEQSKKEA